ncbi:MULTISPECIES: FAD-dependent oxidoreductase [unclassified Novosphingobium]|uniref:GcvT family protein n=1 Tax=unclassified Novosphingobium TaxID=2644732 RepID=UPI00149400EB|nr:MULTISPECIES: FAD-dependent oxidoreductase [unclassified Novosphingobium]MBB3357332.1 dimethylglycine dehydrogenase [Novosphingobium sp. BK256]MBB3374006.1 dimethylglycine dehydrogenase [Novosphingobium sp. BK280]MBB3378418.1 dimethylglycine dehydrogenase [Novosphingobium sp. BK258]MBB3419798.1 dimethylglycine dehydrogenase [Novosphingobium sp. BK267]MBB3447881.1 dimethylglycine dehydrogenase [Novosphingobium sp. BK352]
MKTTARVVVIGGGVVGVSTLYHLAKMGWSDVVLIERKELTSGSTWHAAGLLPLFNLSYSVGKLHQYSVDLYPSLEAETDLNVGFSRVSNIRLANSPDRMDEYRYYAGVAKTIGVDVNFLTPEQVHEIWPLAQMDGVLGAIQHPADGYIQPADLTQALAKGARQRGATIMRNTTVTGITQKANGEWVVATDQGEITCEHVVSATGSFARQTGAMVGLDVPVIPVEHQYIVTEQHPAIMERRAKGLPEMGVLRESDSSWYMREEAGGLLLGPYEVGAPACYVKGPAANSEYELFPDALERLEPYILSAIERVPAFGELGIKKVYNGAIAYTPDGSPIVGPAPGLKNFWLNEGHSFGITAAGGAGWQLAHWIVDGEPTIDMMGVDPRRFGTYADEGYLIEKNEEAYAKVFTVHYPDEEREAARPLRQTPCYDRMKKLGAVFGSVFGWERPNWFAPEGYELTDADLDRPETLLNHNHPDVPGAPIREKWSFRRSNYFEHVGNECRHVTEKVGIQDMSAFAKCRISGPGAEDWLGNLLSNAVPKKIGRVSLSYLLTPAGGVRSEFTVYKRGPQSYYLVSAGALEQHDHDYLIKALPADGSVKFERLTTAMGVLVLAGPRARDVLAKVTRTDLSNEAFPWLTGKRISIGAAPCDALRVNFIGELGWEFHHPIEMQNYIFDKLMDAGAEFDIKPFGIRAMTSMALEKSYKLIPRELSVEYNALESGLERFISMKKPDFVGRDGLLAKKEAGLSSTLVTLEVLGVTDADARGSEAIYRDGQLVGRATSGGYGWRTAKSLALAMIAPEHANLGTELEISILGTMHKAVVIPDSPFDPENLALRS